MCGADEVDAQVPFYPLAEIHENMDLQELAVAREDYSAAARHRDSIQTLRQRDEFTRISSDLGQAREEERFEDAATLRDALIKVTMRRSAAPPSLNRLLLLTAQRGLATCKPDGSDLAPLTARGSISGRRYTQPTWSPSGDLVAAVAYTGTALSSNVDARHDLVVLQARDGVTAMEEPVDFPPYQIQWAGSGCSLCYLSRSLRAHSKLVSVDVLPRPAGRVPYGGARSTRDTVRSRVLREGDLLFFTHLGTGGGGRGAVQQDGDAKGVHEMVAVHSSVDGLVELLGADPRQPTNSTVITSRSGLFSAPQWCSVASAAGGDYVLLAEEVVVPGSPAASAGARERERQVRSRCQDTQTGGILREEGEDIGGC